jgi:hypothetical protein
MAFNNVDNQLQYIAKNGNYTDIANAMALICAFSSVYTTGQVPNIKQLRGGVEASAIAGLEKMLTGATSQVNSIHEYNKARDDFFAYVAATNGDFYSTIDNRLFPRICVVETPVFPVDVTDCEGTVLGNAIDLDSYLTLWNDQKVDADRAICGIGTSYLFDTGVSGYLGQSKIQPNNTKITYNAPAVTQHRQRDEFNNNRNTIVDKEAQTNPQSIAKYSDNNI